MKLKLSSKLCRIVLVPLEEESGPSSWKRGREGGSNLRVWQKEVEVP
jgi:hypothetical protein